jgi:hypothetical protein
MEVFYYVVFGALSAVVAGLELGKSGKDRVATPTAFNAFKNNYVLVYSLMMCTPRPPSISPLPSPIPWVQIWNRRGRNAADRGLILTDSAFVCF